MFNTELQVINSGVVALDDHIELQMTIGIAVPSQEGGLSFIPSGVIRVPMGKNGAIALGEKMKEEAEALPDPPKPSDLVIPKNAAQVAEEAKRGPDDKGR